MMTIIMVTGNSEFDGDADENDDVDECATDDDDENADDDGWW